jgi:tripartite-type tricarboxylate transporter receptor subunit TctC
MKRRQMVMCCGWATVAAWSGLVRGEEVWPSRLVTIVVPYTPGGLTDHLGRLVAEQLRPLLTHGVVVENRPGAGTLLGASLVAKAQPDGYTLMIATSSTMGISEALFAKPLIKASDLSGIAMLGAVTLFLVANPDFPASTLPEAVAVMKAKPGAISIASPGNGTPHHLLSEMLKTRAGVSALHVPYRGSAEAISDLMSGRVQLMILDATVALPLIKAGKLKVLATTAPKRSQLLPNVASMAEFYPDMNLQVWQALVGPDGMPPEIVARLHDALDRAMATPEFRKHLLDMGVEPISMSTEEFAAMVRRDEPRWAELVKASGAKVD